MEDDRFDVESPDSGVDFDIDNALIGMDDPIFNDFRTDFVSQTANAAVDTVIPLDIPVVIYSEFSEHVKDEEIASVDLMEEFMEEEEQEVTSDEDENRPSISKNHPTELHSYSVLKSKTNNSRKLKKSTNHKSKTLKSAGRKFKVSVDSDKKRKLYEMEPLADPVAERNRLNAMNAKKNRDRKKQQLAEAEDEISRLREENDELRAEAGDVKDELAEARQELEALRAALKLQRGGVLPPALDEREE